MAPVVPGPERILEFKDSQAFESWLAANHDQADELWLKIHKKGSGLPSISSAEALDVVLCWGWIDGIRKAFDDRSFLQRYSPRGKRSIWSEINKGHVARLIEEGRMTKAGMKQVEAARADGRWARAYQGAKSMEFPADLLAAIEDDPTALEMFETLNAQNRYALAFRTHNIKTEAGRKNKIESFVQMLKRGETPHPNGSAKRK